MKSRSKKSAAIASGHPETTAAAKVILEAGGNAYDAVMAAMAAACVAEPVLASMGGGGFLLVKPANGRAGVYDFFAHTPLRSPSRYDNPSDCDFRSVTCDFGTAQQEFKIGMGAIATPGVIKGLFEVSQDLGRMPIKRVLEPALALARDGVTVNDFQAYVMQVVGGILTSTPASRALYTAPDDADAPNRLLREGETFYNPDFADALDTMSIEGPNLFYRGEIGRQIAEDSRGNGGTLTRADLEKYELIRRHPLVRDYKGRTVLTNPPPSTGGILIGFALAMLENIDFSRMTFGSVEHLNLLARCMELTDHARIERALHQVDEREIEQTLFEPELLDVYQRLVLGQPLSPRGTTHISVIDHDGNAAALSVSNGEGAGYIVPGTGIMLNNMLGEADINPHGFHQWPAGVRMSSMMAPSIVLGHEGDIVALGSGGANRIRTAIFQVLLNLVEFDMPLDQAIGSPRIHLEHAKLDVEHGFDPDLCGQFAAPFTDPRLWTGKNMFFGGVHGVQMDAARKTFRAAGDPRRGGSAEIL